MADDLIQLHERIRYARTEITTLDQEVQAFVREHIKLTKTPVPMILPTGRITLFGASSYYVSQDEPVPVPILARAGTTANEIRSCLDALACTLAVRNGGTKSDVYFPVSKSEAVFLGDGKRKLRKLSEADLRTIEELRPFKGGHPLLFGLHEADRLRKHQALTGCFGSAGKVVLGNNLISVEGGASVDMTGATVNGVRFGKTHIMPRRELISSPGQPVLVASNIPHATPIDFELSVGYAEPEELYARAVVPTLTAFADEVERIIGMFD